MPFLSSHYFPWLEWGVVAVSTQPNRNRMTLERDRQHMCHLRVGTLFVPLMNSNYSGDFINCFCGRSHFSELIELCLSYCTTLLLVWALHESPVRPRLKPIYVFVLGIQLSSCLLKLTKVLGTSGCSNQTLRFGKHMKRLNDIWYLCLA